MSDALYIDEAARWSREMTRMRARGPGDVENAMGAIERDYGVAYGIQWSLRYRRDRLKTISVSVYVRIKAAYDAERERQIRLLSQDATATAKVAGANHPAVVAAQAVVGASDVQDA